MARGQIRKELDEALSESRIVLLSGLPRVGRSALVQGWCDEHSEATLEAFEPEGGDKSAVMVFDHLASADVPAFVARFRRAEKAKANTRFLVAPVDLLATRLLHADLAGSVQLVELGPLQLTDIVAERAVLPLATADAMASEPQAAPAVSADADADAHWLRGGMPESLAAASDHASFLWRRRMLESLMARDYKRWNITAAIPFPEILEWLASRNGNELDEGSSPLAKRAELLSVLRVLDELGVTRRLQNLASTSSVVRLPKLYIRDSGVLHALLGLATITQLRAHDAVGESREAYAIESLIQAAGSAGRAYFYRSKAGEREIDLLIDLRQHNGRLVAIECKSRAAAALSSGFFEAATDLKATDQLLVHAGAGNQSSGSVERVDLLTAIHRVSLLSA